MRHAGKRPPGAPRGCGSVASVNLFATQLHGDALLKDIDDALRQTGLPGDALELEITENVALNGEDAIEKTAEASRARREARLR
jgi:EAL domain-containing protein (putative c-di-GMP-specific phosphodiesterase class I)